MSVDLSVGAPIQENAIKFDTDKMQAFIDDGVGWMIYNNPARRNAISHEMKLAMIVILEEFQRNDAVRVVVLRGAGDKAFVSGSDISQFEKKRATPEQQLEFQKVGQQVQERYDALEKPLIAMIQGFCLGGGLGTALQADLRIASDDAQFGIPAGRLGIAYNYPGLKNVVELIGPSRAKEMLFTARRYSAQEALQMGLINEVVPREALESRVREIAAMIADNAPLSVKAAKLMTREIMKDPGSRDLELCKSLVEGCFASNDYKEGRTAFMAKRKPVFTGH